MTTKTMLEPNPVHARALAQVYDLLIRRARGDGIVAYYGTIPAEGPGGDGAAGIEVNGQRGLVAVRCKQQDESESQE